MTWQPKPHQLLQPVVGEMKELLNIPRKFLTPPPNKPEPCTACSGKTSKPADKSKNSSLTWTNRSKHWKPEGRTSMDELWRSVPSRKISKSGSGKSIKPYSQNTPTTRAKPKLSQHLGLPPQPNQKRKSLAERLGVPPSPTPWGQATLVENPPQLEQGSASEPQPLLKWLQPLPLLQRLTSPSSAVLTHMMEKKEDDQRDNGYQGY
jgi:hypothetical protein